MEESTVGTLGWFIDTVLLRDLRRMILDCNLHYLGFGLVASGIEFLGACTDEHPLDISGQSKARFNLAVTSIFDDRYAEYIEGAPEHNLYTNLRCGMSHIMRPQGDVVFTTRTESEREGTTHLHLIPETNKLVLVSENLYTDFAEAATKLRREMAAGDHPKHTTDPYLAITQ